MIECMTARLTPHSFSQWLALVVLALAASAPARPAAAQTAEEFNSRALGQMEENKYREAIANFERARRILPRNETIRLNLALAHNAWGVELARMERFQESVTQFVRALSISPRQALVTSNLTTTRFNWAVKLMGEGRLEEAEGQLAQAHASSTEEQRVKIDQSRSYNKFLMARAEIERDRRPQAISLLEAALKIDPENLNALLELAQLHYDRGETRPALELWQRAAGIDPTVPGLGERITRVAREFNVEENFSQRPGRRFNLSYGGDVGETTARFASETLERAWWQICRDLDCRAERTITVVLYTQAQYSEATVAPHWSSGLYDGRIRIPLRAGPLSERDRDRMRVTLRHELTHAIVVEIAGDSVPAWLNEGLAAYYEIESRERDRRDDSDRGRLVRSVRRGMTPSVGALPASFTALEDAVQVEQAYLHSRAFVAWLGERYRPTQFTPLLNALGGGATMDEALQRAYGKTLAELEGQWVRDLDR